MRNSRELWERKSVISTEIAFRVGGSSSACLGESLVQLSWIPKRSIPNYSLAALCHIVNSYYLVSSLPCPGLSLSLFTTTSKFATVWAFIEWWVGFWGSFLPYLWLPSSREQLELVPYCQFQAKVGLSSFIPHSCLRWELRTIGGI